MNKGNGTRVYGNSIGYLGYLSLILVIFKLAGIGNYSWLIALLPEIIAFCVSILIGIIVGISASSRDEEE